MEVPTLKMPHDEAQRQLTALKEVFRANKSVKQQEIYRDMRRVYGHMKHGGKVIDISLAVKQSGLNDDGDPLVAICRADASKCYLFKNVDGSAIFSSKPFPYRWNSVTVPRKSYKDVFVPAKTLEWPHKDNPQNIAKTRWEIGTPQVSTVVPLIPAPILVDEVKRNLSYYFILWDVEKWEPEPPVDPILLKRLTPNLFGVLATWDLTEVERSILRSHILRDETN